MHESGRKTFQAASPAASPVLTVSATSTSVVSIRVFSFSAIRMPVYACYSIRCKNSTHRTGILKNEFLENIYFKIFFSSNGSGT
ncbi:predicted protein [Methanosarcina acetivorans C2A]|uniref:Uncharacterized protein n=1 Tax=Methanosarcina acetivorans (strain ATCC 35395 / DSM 2834 / JCM 12185 / C2A) TaxID=188937 RepID=Q8TPR1_METAC|nr:predicted protein [Methanosarcina acetivorans C2A]